jgi:hypothetical protein
MRTHIATTATYRENLQKLTRAMLAAHGGNQQVLIRALNSTNAASEQGFKVAAQSFQRWTNAVESRQPETSLRQNSLAVLAAYRSEIGSFLWTSSGEIIRDGTALYHAPIPTAPDEINDFLWNGVFRTGRNIYDEVAALKCRVGELETQYTRLEKMMESEPTPLQKAVFNVFADAGIDHTDREAVLAVWDEKMSQDYKEYSGLNILGILSGRIDLRHSEGNKDELIALSIFLDELGSNLSVKDLYNLANPDNPIKDKEQNGNGVTLPVGRR